MFKRSLFILTASGLVAVSANVSAGNSIGYDADYVLNPNGKEVPQTHSGVGQAFGFDPWYVPGDYQRPTQYAAPSNAAPSKEEPRIQAGHAYSDPAFGFQADS